MTGHDDSTHARDDSRFRVGTRVFTGITFNTGQRAHDPPPQFHRNKSSHAVPPLIGSHTLNSSNMGGLVVVQRQATNSQFFATKRTNTQTKMEKIMFDELPASGDGELPASGDGELPASGDGELPASGDGELPASGDALVAFKRAIQIPEEGFGRANVALDDPVTRLAELEDSPPTPISRPSPMMMTAIRQLPCAPPPMRRSSISDARRWEQRMSSACGLGLQHSSLSLRAALP